MSIVVRDESEVMSERAGSDSQVEIIQSVCFALQFGLQQAEDLGRLVPQVPDMRVMTLVPTTSSICRDRFRLTSGRPLKR